MLSAKAGVVHVHVGKGPGGLKVDMHPRLRSHLFPTGVTSTHDDLPCSPNPMCPAPCSPCATWSRSIPRYHTPSSIPPTCQAEALRYWTTQYNGALRAGMSLYSFCVCVYVMLSLCSHLNVANQVAAGLCMYIYIICLQCRTIDFTADAMESETDTEEALLKIQSKNPALLSTKVTIRFERTVCWRAWRTKPACTFPVAGLWISR